MTVVLLQVFSCWTVRLMSMCVFCITKASVDISHSLIHGHVYETSAQAVMGEDEQKGLQQLVDLVQSLEIQHTHIRVILKGHGIDRCKSPWSYCGALKKVQDEGDGTAVDANEEVDTRQRDVGCAGHTEYEGHGVHHGRHRPAKRQREIKEKHQ